MKIKVFTSVLALFLLSFATSQLATAQTAEPAARGTYQFSFEDGYAKYADFDAATQTDGSTTGQLFFSDEQEITDQDVDGTGDPDLTQTYRGFYVKATFDGLVVNNNQAVMSGTVSESSTRYLIGQRVLLTVEDNGDNTRIPDKLTWGFYQQVEKRWTASDAELSVDPGVGLNWIATDAERRDDAGVSMPRSEKIDTKTFPLSTYSFDDAESAAGDIAIHP
ncbi:MAG TPA: hypothetical protein VGN95_07345 [Pyrinomonadaceae bacterium]|jgi:hypothetical protein|nr:hypothetical protein [Pyrinomonadaceae bacterium]